jgi:hypothetical protein
MGSRSTATTKNTRKHCSQNAIAKSTYKKHLKKALAKSTRKMGNRNVELENQLPSSNIGF